MLLARFAYWFEKPGVPPACASARDAGAGGSGWPSVVVFMMGLSLPFDLTRFIFREAIGVFVENVLTIMINANGYCQLIIHSRGYACQRRAGHCSTPRLALIGGWVVRSTIRPRNAKVGRPRGKPLSTSVGERTGFVTVVRKPAAAVDQAQRRSAS